MKIIEFLGEHNDGNGRMIDLTFFGKRVSVKYSKFTKLLLH